MVYSIKQWQTSLLSINIREKEKKCHITRNRRELDFLEHYSLSCNIVWWCLTWINLFFVLYDFCFCFIRSREKKHPIFSFIARESLLCSHCFSLWSLRWKWWNVFFSFFERIKVVLYQLVADAMRSLCGVSSLTVIITPKRLNCNYVVTRFQQLSCSFSFTQLVLSMFLKWDFFVKRSHASYQFRISLCNHLTDHLTVKYLQMHFVVWCVFRFLFLHLFDFQTQSW